jgi:hypothetical protein
MAALCDAAIHLCYVRVTRLDNQGNPTAGPNNTYVTDKAIDLMIKPVIEAGQDKTLIGGCDCIIATYRGFDKLKRFDLEMNMGVIEPGLLEMMLGASAILSAGVPIGLWFQDQLSCSSPVQPNVAIEGWQDLWSGDHPETGTLRYVHWIFPASRWQLGDVNLQNDFNQPKVTGYTRANPVWGVGPYHDAPETVKQQGGFFYDSVVPVAACGYQSHTIT